MLRKNQKFHQQIKAMLFGLLVAIFAFACESKIKTSQTDTLGKTCEQKADPAKCIREARIVAGTLPVDNLIALTPPESLSPGAKTPLTVSGSLADGSPVDLSEVAVWTSSDPSIVEIVVESGKSFALAHGTGTVTLTMTIQGKTIMVEFRVAVPVLNSIEISPAAVSIAKGSSATLVATGIYSDKTTADITAKVSWTLGVDGLASISSSGEFTGLQFGTSTLTADLEGVSAKIVVAVTGATLTSIQLTPGAVHLATSGASQDLVATGIYSDGTSQIITKQLEWTSADPTIATISNDPATKGKIIGASLGLTQITCSLGEVSESIDVAVGVATLSSLEISPGSVSLAPATVSHLTVTGIYSDSSNQDVSDSATWTTSDSAVATVSDTSPSKGLVTAVTAGVATITATYQGKVATRQVSVSSATLNSIAVTPLTPTVLKNLTQQFIATGTYSDSTAQDITTIVTWNSSVSGVASISNAYDNNGLATALGVGTTTVTATRGGISGNTVLTVTPGMLSSIVITPGTASKSVGVTQPFTAIGTFADNSTTDLTSAVTWTSDDTTKASISNIVGTKGLASAISAGFATISAMLNGITGTAGFTVSNFPLVSIAVSPVTPSKPVGPAQTQQFTALGSFSDNSTASITNVVTWSSSDNTKATISNANGSRGLATPLVAGTTNITATLNGVSNFQVFTVTPPAIASIAVTPTPVSISMGQAHTFVATALLTDNTSIDISNSATWVSSNTGVATIDSAGVITTVAAGSTMITAAKSGITSPDVALTVTVLTPAATPVLSLASATYSDTQTLTISTSGGAAIHYTTNGSTPTDLSPLYVSALTVNSSQTIKAISVKAGMANSAVATGTYVIKVATPTFTVGAGTYTGLQNITIATTGTSGAAIYYTTDASPPSASSTLYPNAPVAVANSLTLKAIALKGAFDPSDIAAAFYSINVDTPTFSPPAGTYTSGQSVTISSTPGATIHCRTDGVAATLSDPVCSSAITVNTDMTITAIAEKASMNASAASSASYTITGTVATPVLSAGTGTYPDTQSITITVGGGAAIHYTTDGSTPDINSPTYSGAIAVTSTAMTIKAIGTKAAWLPSAVVTGVYTLRVATPSFTVGAGTYTGQQSISIATTGTGTPTIYYTTDGNDPTTSSLQYSGPITVFTSLTLKAWATRTNFVSSVVGSAVYSINVDTPTFSPPAGTYTSGQSVTISSTSGATIHCRTDGVAAQLSDPVCSSAITVNADMTITAIAEKASMNTSAASSAAYTITGTVATPTFSIGAGTYVGTQSVTLTEATPGAAIHYTTDTSTPTIASPTYSGAISVPSTTTIKAIGTKASWTSSAVASATYTIETGDTTATHIGFASSYDSLPPTIYSGACTTANPLRVQARSAVASVTTNGVIVVTLGATGTTHGAFYSDSGCTAAISTIRIESGASDSASFYYKDTSTGTLNSLSINVSATGKTAPSPLTPQLWGVSRLVVYSSATPPITAVSDGHTCNGPVQLESQHGGFSAHPFVDPTNAVLTTSPSTTVTFYSNSGCTTPLPTVSVTGTPTPYVTFPGAAGVNPTRSQAFYFLDTETGHHANEVINFTTNPADSAVTGGASSGFTIDGVENISFNTTFAPSIDAHTCTTSTPLKFISKSTAAAVTKFNVATNVALTTNSSSMTFYTNSDCSTLLPTVSVSGTPRPYVTFNANSSQTNDFYFRDDRVSGTQNNVAITGNIYPTDANISQSAVSSTFSVNAIDTLSFNGSLPPSFFVGSCSTAISVRSQFATVGYNVPSNTTILATYGVAGTFYKDSGCNTVADLVGGIASTIIPAGQNTSNALYFKASTTGTGQSMTFSESPDLGWFDATGAVNTN